MDRIIPDFQFGGHTIGVAVKEIPQEVEYMMENVAASPGTCKALVLRNGLASVKVDGQNRPLFHRESGGGENFRVPNIRDREKRKSLSEELLKHIVFHNDFLTYDDRFEAIFADYLPEEEREKENPTDQTA